MILEHRGARPTIDSSAYVAPTAVGAHREDRECA
jgi:hypothetical protein